MATFFETRSFCDFTEDQQKYYKKHRLSQKGKPLWEFMKKVNLYAENISFLYDIKCSCGRRTLIATDEELGGAPSEGVDVASNSFPSITNRDLSNL